ncbi:DNA-binding protein [Williamsia sp.]|uniref:helix-turn-helix transcriptional regulator n=1 Tax=Williamsia sp. TaxID=1872085 RepID=UPI002F937AC6
MAIDASPLALPSEVAAYFRTSEAKLAQDRFRGIGPRYVKHGRRVLYRWADVHAWADANTLQRTDDRPVAS